ncbi:Uncharacterised protein [Candidatus Norongarragalina meridionalis]|nr:Uncharacterised protein [Candidatus Norongarragalina meridionalis]
MAESMMSKLGPWAFIVGLVIAILAGFVYPTTDLTIVLVLGVLGIIVGVLNISGKEVNSFLLATVAFMVGASSLGAVLAVIPAIGPELPRILDYIVAFIAPGAALVALKAIYEVAKEK